MAAAVCSGGMRGAGSGLATLTAGEGEGGTVHDLLAGDVTRQAPRRRQHGVVLHRPGKRTTSTIVVSLFLLRPQDYFHVLEGLASARAARGIKNLRRIFFLWGRGGGAQSDSGTARLRKSNVAQRLDAYAHHSDMWPWGHAPSAWYS